MKQTYDIAKKVIKTEKKLVIDCDNWCDNLSSKLN